MDNVITLNGEKYVRQSREGKRMRIVIVDNRGLTFVGRCDLSGDNEQIVIENARCIIQWGTTQHLAQLAEGPTKDTVLGMANNVIVFRRNLVAAYDVNEEAWE